MTPAPGFKPHEHMRQFIKSHGGRVRFDVFAREHLMGEHGFYRQHADLENHRSQVPTPSNTDKGYAQALAEYLGRVVAQRAQMLGLPKVTFAEVGGGCRAVQTGIH